ncbi:MAG: tRNA glutamyl-Q(34) synthetase GluQRS [Pseudomonadota bacterium]
MSDFRTRFAPSPTGALHLGHALSACLVRRAADAASGEALLRIEDTDIGRCRPEYEAAIHDDLAWLGLAWDGQLRRQSQHFDAYMAVIAALRDRGLVYRCFLSSQEQADRFPDGPVRGSALPPADERDRLAVGAPFAWRLSLDAVKAEMGGLFFGSLSFQVEEGGSVQTVEAQPERHGDIALTRKDSPAAYHLAATHDDALQGITHVIRGEDLIDAPHIQTVLQAIMEWPRPIYRHHALLLGPDGKRLSKTHRSKSLAALRAEGLSPQEVIALAGL